MSKSKQVGTTWVTEKMTSTWASKLGDKFDLYCPVVVEADWATQRNEIRDYLRKYGVRVGLILWPPTVPIWSIVAVWLGIKRTDYIHFTVNRRQYRWTRTLLLNAGYTLGRL